MSSHIVEVVKIEKIEPHPNADRLELAFVKGWQVIVGKGQFQPGDIAVYIPIDSILPDELAEKLGVAQYLKGDRVRTVKLRGQISQGILFKPEVEHRLGQNVADYYHITKYEPPVPQYQQSVGKRQPTRMRPNPHFSRYVDIENIKHFPDVFKDGEEVVILEKIHGTNLRVANVKRYADRGFFNKLIIKLFGEYEFLVGSRNVQLTSNRNRQLFYQNDVYTRMALKYRLNKILPKGWTIYGEVYGKGIQDLTYGLDDIDAIFFDLRIEEKYADWDTFVDFCEEHNLPTVPVLYRGPFSMDIVKHYTDGQSVLCPTQIREGCVVRSARESFDPRIGRKILKSISDAYLLRNGGTEYH